MKLVPLFLILVAVLLRLLPHPSNVAPITALALFGGVYLPRRYFFALPLIALFLSDLIIGFYGVVMLFVYGSFLISSLIGFLIKNHKNLVVIFGGTLLSSVFFYIITNFGVWIGPNSWYSRDLSGLLNCYIAALPFFRNTILGDLFYTGLFFGGYELIKRFANNFLSQKVLKVLF